MRGIIYLTGQSFRLEGLIWRFWPGCECLTDGPRLGAQNAVNECNGDLSTVGWSEITFLLHRTAVDTARRFLRRLRKHQKSGRDDRYPFPPPLSLPSPPHRGQPLRITHFLHSQKKLEGDGLILAGKHNSDRAVLVKCYIASSVGHFLPPSMSVMAIL